MKNTMPQRAAEMLFLPSLRRHGDAGLLLLRLLVGAFLVWGVADNILSAERMQEFEAFLARFGFPYPAVMAPLSVWAQFFVGAAFVLGLLTRWAGVICAVNFIVAIAMVDGAQGIRAAFPSACLVAIGVYLAMHGAGRYGLDRLFEARLVGDARH
ncbi:MAG TPA: DoxX family protein [Paucimonas sp.]|nr:DoxX family protein [Paucimonas sp.]